MICCAAQAVEREVYFNNSVPANAGSYNNSITQVGNDYHTWNSKTQTYDSYTRDNEHIYASDGTRYTGLGNGTIYNNSTGDRYYSDGYTYEPLY